MALKLRIYASRDPHGANEGHNFEQHPTMATLADKEALIETGVMRHYRRIADELRQGAKDLAHGRGVVDHPLRDAGVGSNKCRYSHIAVNQGLESIQNLTLAYTDGANFGYTVA